jgi:citronellol/citronellal dehydrogenase
MAAGAGERPAAPSVARVDPAACAGEGRPFAGRRALVTGASRGIGAAVAEALARRGADVAITARTLKRHPTLPGSLEEVATRMRPHGGRIAVVVADMSDEEDRARIVPEAMRLLGGPLDILVNNAAAAIYQKLSEFPLHRRRLLFDLNVHAPLDLAQAAAPPMVSSGEGWILNVSSGSARNTAGPPFETSGIGSSIGVYGASKAALNRLTNALGVELWGTGVRVNTLEPRAAVMTEGASVLVGDVLRPDQVEPIETMVEAALALCRCEPERTGLVHVSLDLLEELGIGAKGPAPA